MIKELVFRSRDFMKWITHCHQWWTRYYVILTSKLSIDTPRNILRPLNSSIRHGYSRCWAPSWSGSAEYSRYLLYQLMPAEQSSVIVSNSHFIFWTKTSQKNVFDVRSKLDHIKIKQICIKKLFYSIFKHFWLLNILIAWR